MFGGVCFMVGGNMAVGVHNQDLIIRIGKIQADALMTEPHVRPMNVTGKVMKEWALVQPDGVRRDEDLRRYVLMGYAFARTLPRK